MLQGFATLRCFESFLVDINFSDVTRELRIFRSKYDQKSIIESDYNNRIDYLVHKDTGLPNRKDFRMYPNLCPNSCSHDRFNLF